MCICGGNELGDQVDELKRGAEIVVCTPFRILQSPAYSQIRIDRILGMFNILSADSGKTVNLRRVTYLVMDELDHMLGIQVVITFGRKYNQLTTIISGR